MKKRVVLCFMLGCMMAVFAGCGSTETKEAAATVAETEEDSKGKGSRGEESEVEEVEVEQEDKKSSDGPVLGGESIEGYEGFAYLYEELLLTETEENEETGKKERKKLTVYIPDDEYTTANGNYAYANMMGVNFRVELEPYFGYKADEKLPEENLDEYVENKYDPFYTADYKDVVINSAEKVGNGIVSTVEYCRYNEWDEVYYSVFATYYLTELESGESVLVSAEITSEDVTGKTEGLLKELEQFYQFDINWDAERASKKSADYAENGTENKYSTGSLLFELPEGWEEDGEISSYDMRVYAPEGDATYSGSMVAVSEEYMDFDEEVNLNAVIDSSVEEMLKEMFGDSLPDYSSEICDTGLGKAAKITFTLTDGEEEVSIVLYVVLSDYKMYRLVSYDTSNAVESAAMVLDGIMATGRLKD